MQETSVVDLAPMPEPDALPPPISITDAQYALFEALTLGIRDYVQKPALSEYCRPEWRRRFGPGRHPGHRGPGCTARNRGGHARPLLQCAQLNRCPPAGQKPGN
ncbi:MAG: hypothetical protein R2857_01505 [Vampirovibrionales bacterium]